MAGYPKDAFRLGSIPMPDFSTPCPWLSDWGTHTPTLQCRNSIVLMRTCKCKKLKICHAYT